MIRDTPLTAWLLDQFGAGKRYPSARDLSLACGPDHGMVGKVLAKGEATGQVLLKLARATDTPTAKLFVLNGWIKPEELEGPQLDSDEETLVKSYRKAAPLAKRLILSQARQAASMPDD